MHFYHFIQAPGNHRFPLFITGRKPYYQKAVLFMLGYFFMLWVPSEASCQASLSGKRAGIHGNMTDKNQQPVSFATVSLYNRDSILITAEFSQDNGTFLFHDIMPGDYYIVAEHLEFQSQTTPFFTFTGESPGYIPVIIMENSSVALDEVVVTARKALIEIQADKLVFNVAASPGSSGMNGLDLLRKAPGVIVDMENNISLLGKGGVQIYINGVPSRLSGNDLTTMLQSISSDNVEAIEIISNPSSRYDAEGNAGIINIKLKKNMALGFNGNITSSFTKGKFYRTNNSAGVNYGGKKLKINLDLSRSEEDIQDDIFTLRLQNAFVFDQKAFEIRSRTGYNAGLGADFLAAKHHTLSFTGRAIFNTNENKLNSTTLIDSDAAGSTREILFAQTNADNTSFNYNGNLHYAWSVNKTSFFSADISLGKYTTERYTFQPNTFFMADGTTALAEINQEFNADTDIKLWSAKADYEKTWKQTTFSAGAKYASISTDNDFAFYNLLTNGPELDKTKSNDFSYRESVLALYSIVKTKLGNRFSVNAGLRAEMTDSRGLLLSDLPLENKDVSRNYTDLFPNIGLVYDDGENHMLSMSVGRRITRPSYQDLNPFESPMSQLATWKGNPFLRPNYIMNYQLTYVFRKKLTLTNSFSITKDFFATIFEQSGVQGTVLIPRNMQRANNYGLSVSYPLEINKYWEFVAFLNGSYQSFEGNLEGTLIDLEITNYSFRIQNNLTLPFDMIMDITYHIGSDWIWRGSIRVDGNQGLSFGIRKDFINKKLQVRLTGSDIFRTDSDFYYRGNYGGIETSGVRTFDNRRFGLGATLTFGNQKLKSTKKNDNALDEELRRLQSNN